jgi:hypothetical protein
MGGGSRRGEIHTGRAEIAPVRENRAEDRISFQLDRARCLQDRSHPGASKNREDLPERLIEICSVLLKNLE